MIRFIITVQYPKTVFLIYREMPKGPPPHNPSPF